MRIPLLILFICLTFALAPPIAEAAKPTWSIGVPVKYVFHNPALANATAAGVMLHYTTESNWGFGYEEYVVRQAASGFYGYAVDLTYVFELPLLNITIGGGVGSTAPVQVGIQDGELSHNFIKFGFSFGELDLYISHYDVKANLHTGGVSTDFGGKMQSFGISAKF